MEIADDQGVLNVMEMPTDQGISNMMEMTAANIKWYGDAM